MPLWAASPPPSGVSYAYGFDAASSTPVAGVVANLQPATGAGYDLALQGSYTAGVPGLPAASGGGTLGVLFSGTGTPGVAGGTGSRGYAQAIPATVPAALAVSVGVVFSTNLPTPIPATLLDSPNIAQSGLFSSTTQLKVQVGKNKKANCRFKGLLNGAGGASPAVFAPSASPIVADNAFHTVICTKDVDKSTRVARPA